MGAVCHSWVDSFDLARKVCGMSSRLTLLFVCNQSPLYAGLIAEFRAADFQVLIARNLTQAKAVLLNRSVNVIVLRHDCNRDDRALATPLKRLSPHLPIFLLTDQEQPRPADVDSILRSETDDEVVTRGMALFLRHLFNPRHSSLRPRLVLGRVDPLLAGVRTNGSS